MGRSAHHHFLCPVRQCDIGHTLQAERRILVTCVGHGLSRSDRLTIEVAGRSAVLHVPCSIFLISPELRLRLVHHLFHVDGITCDAKSVADGLCRKCKPVLTSQTLERAVVVISHAVIHSASEVQQHLLRLFNRIDDVACQHRQIWLQVISSSLEELLQHQWCPVLRTALV